MSDDDPFTQALEGLTEDGSFSEAMGRLYVIAKIEAGLKQADAGELIEHQAVWERMRSWVDVGHE